MNFLLEIKNSVLHFWFVQVILGVIALFWLVVVLQKIFAKSQKPAPNNDVPKDNNNPKIDRDDLESYETDLDEEVI